MDDGCAIHWQWRIGGEHVARFYCHSVEEAIDAASAYARANNMRAQWVRRQLEVRKLVHGRAGAWERVSGSIDENADPEPAVIIQPAGLLSAMHDERAVS